MISRGRNAQLAERDETADYPIVTIYANVAKRRAIISGDNRIHCTLHAALVGCVTSSHHVVGEETLSVSAQEAFG